MSTRMQAWALLGLALNKIKAKASSRTKIEDGRETKIEVVLQPRVEVESYLHGGFQLEMSALRVSNKQK